MSGFYPLEVADVRRETDSAVSVRLNVPASLAPQFAFRPGQHLTLRADIDGEEVRRTYSLCRAPLDNEIRIAIKEIAGGRFSTWANRTLRRGAVIDVMPPSGSFTLAATDLPAAHHVGFAGGSGITPILSILRTLLQQSDQARFTLFYANRSVGSIMFLEELAGLKNRFMDRFQLFHFLEEEQEDIELFNGRMDAARMADILTLLVKPHEIAAAYVCGPAPMMAAVESGLKAAAVPEERIRIERFSADRSPAETVAYLRDVESSADGVAFEVRIDGRRRSLRFDRALGSILDNARAAGMAAPYACKAGVCATCRARVLAGDVHMGPADGLSQAERTQGYVLTCQTIPTGPGVVIDFDA
jgi:ring-1,2-phenylacetyl-CoA epoxidase subunit PaaE